MKFVCGICKGEKDGKSYKYSSSSRTVRMEVCVDCHKKNIEAMSKLAANRLGADVDLGVLKAKEK